MVCGYDISASTSMGNVNTDPSAISGTEKASGSIATSTLPGGARTSRCAPGVSDWKYRSWQHNYWKVVKNAEAARERKLHSLDEHDDLGVIDARTNG